MSLLNVNSICVTLQNITAMTPVQRFNASRELQLSSITGCYIPRAVKKSSSSQLNQMTSLQQRPSYSSDPQWPDTAGHSVPVTSSYASCYRPASK